MSYGLPNGPLWWAMFWRDPALGSASYQLYSMVITVQFYLVLPAVLAACRRRRQAAVWLLAAGCVAGRLIRAGPAPPHPPLRPDAGVPAGPVPPHLPVLLSPGTAAGWHLEAVRRFLVRHRRPVPALVLAATGLVLARYAALVLAGGRSPAAAATVFEPAMLAYAAGVTALLWLAGARLEESVTPLAAQLRRLVGSVVGASFGIYLVRVLMLQVWFGRLTPGLGKEPWVFSAILFPLAFGASHALTIVLRSSMVLAWSVGATATEDPSLRPPA